MTKIEQLKADLETLKVDELLKAGFLKSLKEPTRTERVFSGSFPRLLIEDLVKQK